MKKKQWGKQSVRTYQMKVQCCTGILLRKLVDVFEDCYEEMTAIAEFMRYQNQRTNL